MGGTLSRIRVLPIGDEASALSNADSTEARRQWAAQYFGAFDVRHAKCWQRDAEQHLLSVIEAGFGSFDSFNEVVRTVFVTDHDDEAGKKDVEMGAPGGKAGLAHAQVLPNHAARQQAWE